MLSPLKRHASDSFSQCLGMDPGLNAQYDSSDTTRGVRQIIRGKKSFHQWETFFKDAFRMFPKKLPLNPHLLEISGVLGWPVCQGFNRLIHGHTD